ncbi:MAG: DEAD/DEAH box helicase family protein [Candidatus Altiarchaeota archaeon]|nr:DEAD/DEAH box helicase family protein [Candidatus Altiarchaeota archaeon]
MPNHPLLKEGIKLREYQEAVVSVCLDKSCLVVLPTGLGKTIIALFVAAHRLHKFPSGKILFLAPTKPLAQQHIASFKEFLNLDESEFTLLTGEEKVENRKGFWNRARAVFATPQTIENDLIAGNISLSDVSLIIFDECHRAVGEYAYVFIADRYKKTGKNRLSLALTASPGAQKEKIAEIMQNLDIQTVEVKTDQDWDVKPYVEKLDLEWVRIKFPENFMRLKTLLEGVIKDYFKKLKERGYFGGRQFKEISKKDLLTLQSQLRQELISGNQVFTEISWMASLLKVYHALELLETQGIAPLDEYFKRLRKQKSKAVFSLLKQEEMRNAIGLTEILKSQDIDHPKLEKLRAIVKEQIGKKANSKIIVFTQYRDTVEKIIDVLNKEDELVPVMFIGQATKGKQKGMSQKEQKQVLEEFSAGEFNALIATAVGEEGLDIPEVDLVVFYEPIPSEIRSIQRRGRTARKKPGKLVVLMTERTRDEIYFWSAYHKERRMKATLKELKRDFKENDLGVGQSSLKAFVAPEKSGQGREEEMKTGRELYIYVDQRERNSGIAKKLLDMNVQVGIKQLKVADFLISERVAVERKTVSDFLQSIIDKRLLTQAEELTRNFPNPIMVIEGDNRSLYTERNIHPNAIRGAMAAVAVSFQIPIIFTKDPEDTAAFLYVLAKREQEGRLKDIALRGEKRAMSLAERQQFIVESLPNVSAVLAKRLLKHFKSVRNVFNALSKDLQEVDGIGPKKAREIKEVIRVEYQE